jgi:general secretion pathway protein K
VRAVLEKLIRRAAGRACPAKVGTGFAKQDMRKQQDGFIIVAVLWILAALATLATIIAVYVINAATGFTVHDERLQAETLMRAAIELSMYRSTTNPQGALSRGSFAFRLGRADVATEFTAETARIDLNTAPKELLSGLFVGLGAPRGAADGYADQIIAWRAPPQGGPDPASYYRTAGLPYSPRGAPFQHVAELGLVLGIPELMVERATPFVTVYSGQPQVNVFDAAPQVVAALPGMNPERLNAVLALRQRGPQNAANLLATLGPAQAFATTQGSKALRVNARIAFDSGQRMVTEAVIFVLDNGPDPYRILTWRDDADDTRAETR